MNKNIWIVIVLVLLVAAGVGYSFSMQDKNDMMETEVAVQAPTESEKVDMVDGKSMMSEEMAKPEEMVSGSYEAYAPEKLSFAQNGDVVLFFRASWCPSCRGLDKDIKENLASIPATLKILDVDYDTETELKKKYGVTYQHTLVQVDKDGSMIKKWSGSPKLSALVSQVQ